MLQFHLSTAQFLQQSSISKSIDYKTLIDRRSPGLSGKLRALQPHHRFARQLLIQYSHVLQKIGTIFDGALMVDGVAVFGCSGCCKCPCITSYPLCAFLLAPLSFRPQGHILCLPSGSGTLSMQFSITTQARS